MVPFPSAFAIIAYAENIIAGVMVVQKFVIQKKFAVFSKRFLITWLGKLLWILKHLKQQRKFFRKLRNKVISKCNIQTLRGTTFEGRLPFIVKAQTCLKCNVILFGFFEKYNSFASYYWGLDGVSLSIDKRKQF